MGERPGQEWHWLPRLSPRLSLRVPEPVEKGRPTHSYPLVWAIYRWIDGQPDADALVDDERQRPGTSRGSLPSCAGSILMGRLAAGAALAVDGGTWERVRGIALHQAALLIPYYAKTDRGFVALARRTIEEVLAGSGS